MAIKKENIKNEVKYETKRVGVYFGTLIKWLIIATVVGLLVGGFSTLFGISMRYATSFRNNHEFIIYFLPLAGIIIVFLYRVSGYEKDKGTNIVIAQLHNKDEVPLRQAPLIFVSTVLTHLCGGSAGREGAALQMGGSLGNGIGKFIRLDETDKQITVMCGMSAAFAALFGTPMAAAIFSLEIGSVGIMHYSALVPCVYSAVIASGVAKLSGLHPERFTILSEPELNIENGLKILVICVIFAIASGLFCIIMHNTGAFLKKVMQNAYIRIIICSVVIILFAKLLNTTDYLGAGMNVIERAMEGEAVPYAFILKMLFTAITLGAGFKGGEIVPSFFIGATLGCTLGGLFDISPSFCAALGMTGVFCGATNCPLSSLLISFELFGYTGEIYFIMAVAISYMMSGYYSLYSEQNIVYSKTKNTEHISSNK